MDRFPSLKYWYSHGGNAAFEAKAADILDLSANINPLGFPSGVREAIIGAISDSGCYPDNFSTGLREKIADFESVNPEWIFCANGASEIIFRLPAAVRPRRALIPAPSFLDYDRSLDAYGLKPEYWLLRAENGFRLDDGIIGAARGADLLFVCNPNNPTGVLTERPIIEELLKTGAFVAVDECFLDFVEGAESYTCKPFLEKYENLIIIKAFTKIFGLPGIRLGYAITANTRLIDGLYFHGPDWAVSNLAQAAGIAALDLAKDYIRNTVSFVRDEREPMKNELSRLGYQIYDSRANYVFFENPFPFDLGARLNSMGIRIRSCGNFHGLNGKYYRSAVSKTRDNRRFMGAIADISG